MKTKPRKPSELPPPNRIGVYDANDNLRGHVGTRATAATAARFINHPGAKLIKRGSRLAWVAPDSPGAPQPRPKPETANHKSARGSVKAR